MPIFPYQCQECGFIKDELVKHWSDIPEMECPMKCDRPTWKKHHEVLIASAERLKADNSDFPRALPVRESYTQMTKNGPILAERRVVAKNRSDFERLCKKHGVVRYQEPSDGGSQGHTPAMPDDLKIWADHPSVQKYKDMKASGRIPQQMVLTEDELQERFHV